MSVSVYCVSCVSVSGRGIGSLGIMLVTLVPLTVRLVILALVTF